MQTGSELVLEILSYSGPEDGSAIPHTCLTLCHVFSHH